MHRPSLQSARCQRRANPKGSEDDWSQRRQTGLAKEFVTRQKLPYPLLADHEGKVIKAFGVEGMAFGFAKRSAFLFRDGKLVWRDPKGSTSDQGETVLKAIESLPRP